MTSSSPLLRSIPAFQLFRFFRVFLCGRVFRSLSCGVSFRRIPALPFLPRLPDESSAVSPAESPSDSKHSSSSVSSASSCSDESSAVSPAESPSDSSVQPFIRSWMRAFEEHRDGRSGKDIRTKVDIDPYDFFQAFQLFRFFRVFLFGRVFRSLSCGVSFRFFLGFLLFFRRLDAGVRGASRRPLGEGHLHEGGH